MTKNKEIETKNKPLVTATVCLLSLSGQGEADLAILDSLVGPN